MKTVLFVPGFGEDINTRDYPSVIKAIQGRGYDVMFVPINWFRTGLNDWVKQLSAEYSKHDPSQTILAGFSYGSMTALVCAANQAPSELWLFSLSPYFSDDIPLMKKSWLAYIGSRRTEYFKNLEFDPLAQNIKCKTLLFVGELEANKYPTIGRRSKLANEKIVNSKLLVVKGAGHDVSHNNYIVAVSSSI